MKTEFVLRINIGNEATLGDANLADMVAEVSRSINLLGMTDNRSYIVRDSNGNSVGTVGRYVDPEDECLKCGEDPHTGTC